MIETGLGGRLDSTNVVAPQASVITPIELEHTEWLGDTIELIAAEKAGIIKPGAPCYLSRQRPEARRCSSGPASRGSAPCARLPFSPSPEKRRSISSGRRKNPLRHRLAVGRPLSRRHRGPNANVGAIQAENMVLALLAAGETMIVNLGAARSGSLAPSSPLDSSSRPAIPRYPRGAHTPALSAIP